jgi:hypothetical protein
MEHRAVSGRALPAVLFMGAILTTLPIWWQHAVPVATLDAAAAHAGHFPWVYAHMLGGTMMLALGAAALYIGWTRRRFRYHKWFGYAYLGGGALGAGTGLALALINAHPPYGVGVATGTLAVTWLAVAAMALRAAVHRRFDAHRDWVLRSYVLTWTFVGCRIAMRTPLFDSLGEEGITAVIWFSWIVPLIVCEIGIQWSRGAAAVPAREAAP